MTEYNILLATKSPRRHELMHLLDIDFTVPDMIEVEETYPAATPALEVPELISRKKAEAYIGTLKDNDILITADTVVVVDDKILGKPSSNKDACRMLRLLSGRIHKVVTGVTISSKDHSVSFSAITDVHFSELSDQDIIYYVNTYHPLDKAGAYGIQEWIGAVGIKGIDGSFYNVMGLPVHRLYHELEKFKALLQKR